MTYTAAADRLRALAEASLCLTAPMPPGVPDLDAVRARLAERLPALTGEPLIDWTTLTQNVRLLGATLDEASFSLGGHILVQAALQGTWDAFPASVPPETLLVLDYAARPALRAGFARVSALIAAAHWNRGFCPACGALPLLAELRGNKDGEQRVLRCGRCTAAWAFDRLACPACNERRHRQLRYLHVDGEIARRRVLGCATCRFYIKEIARLETLGDRALLQADLDSVGLDVLAFDAGYGRGLLDHTLGSV